MVKVKYYKETLFDFILGYISIIILILFSSSANNIFLGGKINDIPYSYIAIILLYLIIYLFRYRFIPIIYFKIISVLFLYNIIHLIIYQDIHLFFTLSFLFFISVAFFTIRLNTDLFLIRLEKVIYFGAIISLFCFILQILFFDQFYLLVSSLQHLLGIITKKYDGTYYSNVIFYTINTTIHHRNCGFMFEPGAFGSVLVLAIALNLIFNNFTLKNRRLIILLIALVTTQSTTAFLALLSLILFYIVNKGLKKTIILAPISIVVIYFLFQLPFMLNKISDLSKNPNIVLKEKIEYSYYSPIPVSLGRFSSLLLNFEDFKKAPILGLGAHHAISQQGKMGWNVDPINGLGNYLVAFGLSGILLLLYNLYKSFASIKENYKFKGYYFLVLMILVTAFAFDVLRTPLFFSFQIYYLCRVKLISLSVLKSYPPYMNNFQNIRI